MTSSLLTTDQSHTRNTTSLSRCRRRTSIVWSGRLTDCGLPLTDVGPSSVGRSLLTFSRGATNKPRRHLCCVPSAVVVVVVVVVWIIASFDMPRPDISFSLVAAAQLCKNVQRRPVAVIKS